MSDLFGKHLHGGKWNIFFYDMDCSCSFFRAGIFLFREWQMAESTGSVKKNKLLSYDGGTGNLDNMLRCHGKPLLG